MSLSGFITEQETPAQMAQRMGLQSDGSGGYVDESGNVVARTVNNELVFYDPMGGAISAQSDGAQLTQAQPSWRDPVTGELTVPPGQPESPEEMAAIPDAVPALAPPGYSAFMNKKKKDMYANQEPPQEEAPQEEAPQEEEPEMQPEMGMGEEVLTYKKLTEKAAPIKKSVDPNLIDPKIAAQAKLRDADVARRRAMSTDRAAGNVKDSFQDTPTQVAPKPTPRQPVDTASKPVVQQAKKSGEIASVAPKSDIHQEMSHPTKSVGAKMESLQELMEQYGNNIQTNLTQFREDKTKIDGEKGRLVKNLQKMIDREDVDEDTKRSVLNLGNRLLTNYKGGRKDKKLSIIGDEGLDGLLGEAGDDVMKAFEINPETGLPNPQAIRDLKAKRRTREYSDDVINAFRLAIPADMRGLFGGQGVDSKEGFAEWMKMDGRDVMTGAYLSPEFINLDHAIAGSNMRRGSVDQEMTDFVDSNDNLMLIDKGVNQKMGKKEKIDFINQMREIYQDRIEGLQDYTKFDLDAPRMDVHGNLPQKLQDLISDELGDGRVLKKDMDMPQLLEAVKGLQQEGVGIFEKFQKEFLEKYDPDNMIGLVRREDGSIDDEAKRKGPRGLDDKGKRKQAQLRNAYDAVQGIKRDESGIHSLFRALGLPNTWRGDDIRGSSFNGWDGAQESFMNRLAGQEPEKGSEMMKNWQELLARRNKEAGVNWKEGAKKNKSDGLDDKARFASEDNMRATAARNVISELLEKEMISYDDMDDKNRGYLESLMNMSEEFEDYGDEEEMTSKFGFRQGTSVWDLLSILGDIQGEGASPESPIEPSLNFESFRAKMKE